MYSNPNRYPPAYFILSELARTGLEIKQTHGNVMIPCPFHREEHPSLSIAVDNDKGIPNSVYRCFGCGEAGSWTKLAKRLGLRYWNPKGDEDESVYIYKTRKAIKKELRQDGYSLYDWTDEYSWKTYSADFLSHFGARLLYDRWVKTDYLYLPLEYLHDTYGYCKVRLREKDFGSKYWFNPGITKVLYPIDYVLESMVTNCVVLVEGMSDAFRLLSYGIPALAVLGVELTPLMKEQLELLAIKNIIICLDGDKPGREAALGTENRTGLAEKLEKQGYTVRMLIPPDDSDPDSMPIKYVHALGKLCEKLGGPKYTGKRVIK